MKLDVNDEKLITDPDNAVVASELRSLGDEEFAILKSAEMTYIQTFIDEENGISLEYQEGSIEQHFETEQTPSLDEVIAAFVSYNSGDDQWRTMFSWKLLELTEVDYSIVLFCDPQQIDENFSPVEIDERTDLPEIAADHLESLYGIVLGNRHQVLGLTFVAENSPPELEKAVFYMLPSDFQEALAALPSTSIESAAEQWMASDGFPEEAYDLEELCDVVASLSAMAKDSSDENLPLIFVALE